MNADEVEFAVTDRGIVAKNWFQKEANDYVPDLMVIDIDPPGGAGMREPRSVARPIRELYEEVGLTAPWDGIHEHAASAEKAREHLGRL